MQALQSMNGYPNIRQRMEDAFGPFSNLRMVGFAAITRGVSEVRSLIGERRTRISTLSDIRN
jgi:hypothetical protein